MSYETPGLDWSGGRMIPAFQAVQHLDIYDLRGASPDVQLAATTCAGIINRPRPSVYLIFHQRDQYWLHHLLSSLPQFLATRTGNAALDELLGMYRARIQGLIVYDPALPDTINVATTLAGQRGGMVVSPELAETLREVYDLPILQDLRSFGWRHRVQVYTWAQQQALAGSSGRLFAGMRPTIMGGLRSFLVATRAFTCWLDTTAFGPVPGPGTALLSERALARKLCRSFSPGAVYLGWLPDEQSGVALLSRYAIPVLASDFCTNLEVWTAFQPGRPLRRFVPESTAPALEPDKIYLSLTMSDGDNLQYCQHHMLGLWRDSARGTLPLGWTISPVLPQAAPALAQYYYQTATPLDELVVGPSGAGYMFPTYWPDRYLPAFLERTGKLVQSMGLSTLATLDSGLLAGTGLPRLSQLSLSAMAFARARHPRQFAHTLAPYGVRGILTGVGFPWPSTGHWHMVDQIPVYHNLGLIRSVSRLVAWLKWAAQRKKSRRPLFLNFYIEAWALKPSDLKQVVTQLGPDFKLVLPASLLALLREAQQ